MALSGVPKSRLQPRRPIPRAKKSRYSEAKALDYSKGLITYIANDAAPDDALRHITDARISTIGRYTTRKGLNTYTVPAGETLDDEELSTTGESIATATKTTWLADKFTPTVAGRLTKVTLNVSDTSTGSGILRVDIYDDNSGAPGTKLAQGSISSSAIDVAGVSPLYNGTEYGDGTYAADSGDYIDAYLVNAPLVASSTDYWIVAYLQDDAEGGYGWSTTTNATTALTSSDSGSSWSSTSYSHNLKTYISTDGATKGVYRAYSSTGTKVTLLAHGTNLYTVDDSDGSLTSIKSGLTAGATDYYFAEVADYVFIANGEDAPMKYDFSAVTDVGGSPATAWNVIVHKNRVFWMQSADPNRIYWSNFVYTVSDAETFTSTDFEFVPRTKSKDPLTAWVSLNDVLHLFTERGKWALYGNDRSDIQIAESGSIKGTFSQDTVQVIRNSAYFLSDDGVYRFNGQSDTLISAGITDKIREIADVSKVTTGATENRFYIFYPSPGSAENDQCLVYNLDYDSWESLDLNTPIAKTVTFRKSDGGSFVQASNIAGVAYKAEEASNEYAQLGAPLTFELRTKYEHWKQPESEKAVEFWYPRIERVNGTYDLQLQYDKDFANSPDSTTLTLSTDGITWGSGFTFGSGQTFGSGKLTKQDAYVLVPGEARYWQFRYKRTGVNNAADFLGHSIFASPKRV